MSYLLRRGPIRETAVDLDYCPFDIESDPRLFDLTSVPVPTPYGNIMVRVSRERLSDIGTMYIHGVGADWSTWTPLLRATRELGLRAHDQLLVDMPGFGASDNDLDVLNIADVGSTLLDVAAVLGYKKLRIVGHSMGGFLTLDMASRHPDQILSIHLIAGPYFSILESIQHPLRSLFTSPEVGTVFGMQYLISLAGGAGLRILRTACRLGFFKYLLFPFASHPLHLRDSVIRALCRQQNPEGMIQTAANGPGYNADVQWGKIRCPIFAVFGDKDRLVPPKDLARLLKCQPRAKCRTIKDAGHLLHLEWPTNVLNALELWD